MDELLRLVPTVGYGDDAPADRRGGALHLSAVLPALLNDSTKWQKRLSSPM